MKCIHKLYGHWNMVCRYLPGARFTKVDAEVTCKNCLKKLGNNPG